VKSEKPESKNGSKGRGKGEGRNEKYRMSKKKRLSVFPSPASRFHLLPLFSFSFSATHLVMMAYLETGSWDFEGL